VRWHRTVQVDLSEDVRDQIGAAAASARPQETGGLLLGWWDADGVRVAAAAEVVDPSATGVCWTRSRTTAQAALDDALKEIDDPWVGYVGDWHSHPAPVGPSRADRAAITRVSRQYPGPVVLVVHRSPGTLDVITARAGRVVRSATKEQHR
jgi:proteasome lid subunit RPN8/RPN11